MADPVDFTQPTYAAPLVLGGVTIRRSEDDGFRERPSQVRPSQLLMGDIESVTLQIPDLPNNQAARRTFRTWEWDERLGGLESETQEIERSGALPNTTWFVPYKLERWILDPVPASVTTFSLGRELAINRIAGFDTSRFPTKAWLLPAGGSRTEQTVITSGTPTAGEVKVTNSGSVEIPSGLDGDQLEIAYYPAYTVMVTITDYTPRGHNDQVSSVVVTEVGAG